MPAEPIHADQLACRATASNGNRSYQRNCPEQGVLYQVLQQHLASFLSIAAETSEGESGVPRFVEKELRAYLDCGVLARGLIRLHCTGCGKDQVVALSCKGRGFCLRCGGRRMAEIAAHLVDHVIPAVPVRQWVFTVPHRWRYRLGYDHTVCKRVLRMVNRALRDYYRSHCGQHAGHTGTVTFLQRFNSGLALSPHFHVVALDGVFTTDNAGALHFVPASEPSKLDVAEVLANICARLSRLAQDLGFECDTEDGFAADSRVLATCYQGSISRRVTFGARAGRRITRIGADPNAPWVDDSDRPRHSHYHGFDLHAGMEVAASDRERLEQLLRYGSRPALASHRLRLLHDGRVALALKRRYHDGTTALVFDPMTFIAHLAALIPRPHKNLIIYGGVLAPNAKLRSKVVAYRRDEMRRDRDELEPHRRTDAGDQATSDSTQQPARPNYTWADLMRRTFAIDVLNCPTCGGRLRLLSAVLAPHAIRAILTSLKLPTTAPELAPARAPPDPHGCELT